jgi:hypothetical protein
MDIMKWSLLIPSPSAFVRVFGGGGDHKYEGVSESFQTGRLERELQMVQLSATRCSCIAVLRVSLMSFAVITLCVASQRMFIVAYLVMTQSGNFWIHTIMSNDVECGAYSYEPVSLTEHANSKGYMDSILKTIFPSLLTTRISYLKYFCTIFFFFISSF